MFSVEHSCNDASNFSYDNVKIWVMLELLSIDCFFLLRSDHILLVLCILQKKPTCILDIRMLCFRDPRSYYDPVEKVEFVSGR